MEKGEMRLNLKSRVNKERVKEMIGQIDDKRFVPLQKLLIWDLDEARFKSISLVLYLRLGGWSHTAGTYSTTMREVQTLCKTMFGYALPEKIGRHYMKNYRYRAGKGLTKVWPIIDRYHEGRLKKD